MEQNAIFFSMIAVIIILFCIFVSEKTNLNIYYA